jgi:hypothetical protein
MEQIRPEDRRHKRLVQLVKDSVDFSYKFISQRYDKWEKADKMDRCYIDVSETDDKGKKKNPFERQVYIPFSRAIKDVILTYYMNVFFGKRPYFQIYGRGPEDVRGAKIHEIVLDYQMEQQRFVLTGYNFLNDILKYGWANIKCSFGRMWKYIYVMQQRMEQFPFPHPISEKTQQKVLNYEGPVISNSDPYMTFPDIRVPAAKMQDGQFVSWAYKRSQHYLKKMQGNNIYYNIEYLRKIGKESQFSEQAQGGTSRWDTMGLSDPNDEHFDDKVNKDNPNYHLREIVIEIVPRTYGLSDSMQPEKWWLTTVNNELLIRSQPIEFDHNMFPSVTAEFDYDGYSAFNPGYYEGIEGLQDLLNWLFNSHIDNVQRFINDQLVIDPTAIRINDILKPHPAKIIRLKKKLYEQNIPINQVIQQLQVQDVTGSHIRDAELIADLIQRKAHTSDAMQGVETEVKRTATEIAKMHTSGANILQTQAQLLYAQALIPLAEMCVMNNQQLLSQQRYYRIAGEYMKEVIQPDMQYLDGDAILAGPGDIQGHFDYPVNDGTLPIRAEEHAEIWKEIFGIVGNTPPLQMQIDVLWIFKQLAQSMGVKNIEDAIIQQRQLTPNVMPDEQLSGMEQAGDVIPIDQLGG